MGLLTVYWLLGSSFIQTFQSFLYSRSVPLEFVMKAVYVISSVVIRNDIIKGDGDQNN